MSRLRSARAFRDAVNFTIQDTLEGLAGGKTKIARVMKQPSEFKRGNGREAAGE